MTLQGFDKKSYLKVKLAALAANPDTAAERAGKLTADSETCLSEFGFTPETHYMTWEQLLSDPVFFSSLLLGANSRLSFKLLASANGVFSARRIQ